MSELRIALTFDAEHPSRPHCPPDATRRILDTLEDLGVRASFFVQGRWATAQPGLARSIAEAGHLVGNHSHYHASFPLLAPDGVVEDLRQAEWAIEEATGMDARPWFRFPFGEGDEDEGLAAALRSVGYRHVGWDVDPNDWDPGRTAEDVEGSVVDGVLARGDGAIVLLHAWPASTVQALPRVVGRLQAEGGRFLRLDQLASP